MSGLRDMSSTRLQLCRVEGDQILAPHRALQWTNHFQRIKKALRHSALKQRSQNILRSVHSPYDPQPSFFTLKPKKKHKIIRKSSKHTMRLTFFLSGNFTIKGEIYLIRKRQIFMTNVPKQRISIEAENYGIHSKGN